MIPVYIKDLIISCKFAFQALAGFFDTFPLLLAWLSSNKLEKLHDEIIKLESAADPNNRARLGELRVQEARARELHGVIQQRVAAIESRNKSTNP